MDKDQVEGVWVLLKSIFKNEANVVSITPGGNCGMYPSFIIQIKETPTKVTYPEQVSGFKIQYVLEDPVKEFEARVMRQPYRRRVVFRMTEAGEHFILAMESCPVFGDSLFGYSSNSHFRIYNGGHTFNELIPLDKSGPEWLRLLTAFSTSVAELPGFEVPENTYKGEEYD